MSATADHGPALVDVAIVGGGLAGCALASALARTGIDVIVLERQPSWRWRAGGVFGSPVTVGALGRLGVPEPAIARLARPIPAMRLETPGGAKDIRADLDFVRSALA